MRIETIEKKVYSFEDVKNDVDGIKSKVLEKLSDINVDHEWWEYIYDDAERIGLKITSFDTGRASNCEGHLTETMMFTIEQILSEHGESCDTYKLAKRYDSEWSDLVTEHSDGVNTDIVSEDNEDDFDIEADELEKEFLSELLNEYLSILRREYEYLTSEEAILKTIELNEYEFNEDGSIF